MGRALLLTGRPGAGKTTVVRAVASCLGAQVGGFYTEEIREQGQRIGFRLVTLEAEAPQVGILASVGIVSPYRVGRYGVHIDDLEQVGVAAILRAVRSPQVEVLVIDEIGKMELVSPAFRQAVLAALASYKLLLATVMARSQPWVDAIKARPGVTIVEVTPLNREFLPDRVLSWLQEAKKRGESPPRYRDA